MVTLLEARSIAREAFRIFRARGARFLGAAVAFYALFSAAPLVVVVLHVVGLVMGRARAEGALFPSLQHWLAPEGLEVLRSLALKLEDLREGGGIVGAVVLVYAGTRLLRALKRSLNALFGIDTERVEAERPSVIKYAIRYGSALIIMLLVAVFVALLVLVKAAFAFVAAYGQVETDHAIWAADWVLSVGITFALFTALLYALPDARVPVRAALLGALLSTVLFALGSSLITAYVRTKQANEVYQGAGAVVMAVLWVYYSAQTFFLGASLSAALRQRATSSASSGESVKSMTLEASAKRVEKPYEERLDVWADGGSVQIIAIVEPHGDPMDCSAAEGRRFARRILEVCDATE